MANDTPGYMGVMGYMGVAGLGLKKIPRRGSRSEHGAVISRGVVEPLGLAAFQTAYLPGTEDTVIHRAVPPV